MRPVFGLIPLLLSSRAFAAQDPAPAAPTTMTEPAAPSAAIVAQLEAATQDLQMPSETDAPFRVVFYPLDTKSAPAEPKPETEPKTEAALVIAQTPPQITPELIAKLAGAPEDAKLETRDLDEFFANAATVEDWMEDEGKSTAERFAALLETLKKLLKNPQVVVWGEAEKQVAIIGEVEGGLAGVLTIVVET